MITCESCFHYEACKPLIKHCNNLVGAENYQLPFPFKAKTGKGICKNFKDKTSIVDLPVKPGDTVYAYCEYFGLLPYLVGNFHIGYMGKEKDLLHWEAAAFAAETDELLDEIDFELEDIGKDIFLTREEAEKHLNSLQRNEGGEVNG